MKSHNKHAYFFDHESATPSGFESQQRSAPRSITRRDTLKWLGLLTAGGAAALSTSISFDAMANKASSAGHWPELKLKPVSAKGYGKDPNLIIAPETPWPLIMSDEELSLCALLCDIVVPAEQNTPSAGQLNVQAVLNEWVSAPYEWQQSDRVTIMHLLAWLDDEAKLRFDANFTALQWTQQKAIIDDIAYSNEQTPEQFVRPATAFMRLKALILAAFFSTPEGMSDIGYLGNVPIAGPYPGPSEAAYAHLDDVLSDLGLSEFKYPLKGFDAPDTPQ
ncbi:gluconate 2-dehydrogenase subunit 3 family protein [Glaciecola siphonariae]|uniref:Gluconate 2-dehydrogenase subunit 3 family protein n=1 Tax=Glaciecola siphonariae TaxID=521012 RepID=A0ABV9LXH9_9ALTE